MNIKDIQNLIKFVAKSGAQEVKLEMEDVKITIKTGPDSQPIETTGFVQQIAPVQVPEAAPVAPAAPAPAASAETPETAEADDKLITIKSMKLFNEIESEVSGTIVKILVDDASPVEFDQPLFVINPS